MITKSITAAAAAVIFSAAAATASTVVDLTGSQVSGIGTGSGTFDNGTFSGTISISAGTCGFFCSPTLTQHPTEGVGIDQGLFDTDPAIDSVFSETMTFTFDTAVIFESVMFGFVDEEDDWTIKINGITVADESDENPFSFAPGTVGTTLTVSALFTGRPQDGIFLGPDDFNVKSISVAAVPLPASAVLLLAGLGGLGALRRKAANKA